MARAKHGTAPMVAAFVGSLLYLATVAALWSHGYLTGFMPNFWLGVVSSVAVVSSVLLLLVSIGGMAGSESAVRGATSSAVVGGFALLGLAFGNTALTVMVLLGLVLGVVGSSVAKRS